MGIYKKGMLNGQARINFENQDVYDGFCVNGRMEGEGYFYDSESNGWINGLFSEDCCVKLSSNGSNFPKMEITEFRSCLHYSSDNFINKECSTVLVDMSQLYAPQTQINYTSGLGQYDQQDDDDSPCVNRKKPIKFLERNNFPDIRETCEEAFSDALMSTAKKSDNNIFMGRDEDQCKSPLYQEELSEICDIRGKSLKAEKQSNYMSDVSNSFLTRSFQTPERVGLAKNNGGNREEGAAGKVSGEKSKNKHLLHQFYREKLLPEIDRNSTKKFQKNKQEQDQNASSENSIQLLNDPKQLQNEISASKNESYVDSSKSPKKSTKSIIKKKSPIKSKKRPLKKSPNTNKPDEYDLEPMEISALDFYKKNHISNTTHRSPDTENKTITRKKAQNKTAKSHKNPRSIERNKSSLNSIINPENYVIRPKDLQKNFTSKKEYGSNDKRNSSKLVSPVNYIQSERISKHLQTSRTDKTERANQTECGKKEIHKKDAISCFSSNSSNTTKSINQENLYTIRDNLIANFNSFTTGLKSLGIINDSTNLNSCDISNINQSLTYCGTISNNGLISSNGENSDNHTPENINSAINLCSNRYTNIKPLNLSNNNSHNKMALPNEPDDNNKENYDIICDEYDDDLANQPNFYSKTTKDCCIDTYDLEAGHLNSKDLFYQNNQQRNSTQQNDLSPDTFRMNNNKPFFSSIDDPKKSSPYFKNVVDTNYNSLTLNSKDVLEAHNHLNSGDNGNGCNCLIEKKNLVVMREITDKLYNKKNKTEFFSQQENESNQQIYVSETKPQKKQDNSPIKLLQLQQVNNQHLETTGFPNSSIKYSSNQLNSTPTKNLELSSMNQTQTKSRSESSKKRSGLTHSNINNTSSNHKTYMEQHSDDEDKNINLESNSRSYKENPLINYAKMEDPEKFTSSRTQECLTLDVILKNKTDLSKSDLQDISNKRQISEMRDEDCDQLNHTQMTGTDQYNSRSQKNQQHEYQNGEFLKKTGDNKQPYFYLNDHYHNQHMAEGCADINSTKNYLSANSSTLPNKDNGMMDRKMSIQSGGVYCMEQKVKYGNLFKTYDYHHNEIDQITIEAQKKYQQKIQSDSGSENTNLNRNLNNRPGGGSLKNEIMDHLKKNQNDNSSNVGLSVSNSNPTSAGFTVTSNIQYWGDSCPGNNQYIENKEKNDKNISNIRYESCSSNKQDSQYNSTTSVNGLSPICKGQEQMSTGHKREIIYLQNNTKNFVNNNKNCNGANEDCFNNNNSNDQSKIGVENLIETFAKRNTHQQKNDDNGEKNTDFDFEIQVTPERGGISPSDYNNCIHQDPQLNSLPKNNPSQQKTLSGANLFNRRSYSQHEIYSSSVNNHDNINKNMKKNHLASEIFIAERENQFSGSTADTKKQNFDVIKEESAENHYHNSNKENAPDFLMNPYLHPISETESMRDSFLSDNKGYPENFMVGN